jgi:hypothetical protein
VVAWLDQAVFLAILDPSMPSYTISENQFELFAEEVTLLLCSWETSGSDPF